MPQTIWSARSGSRRRRGRARARRRRPSPMSSPSDPRAGHVGAVDRRRTRPSASCPRAPMFTDARALGDDAAQRARTAAASRSAASRRTAPTRRPPSRGCPRRLVAATAPIAPNTAAAIAPQPSRLSPPRSQHAERPPRPARGQRRHGRAHQRRGGSVMYQAITPSAHPSPASASAAPVGAVVALMPLAGGGRGGPAPARRRAV